jgi:amidohydrolase
MVKDGLWNHAPKPDYLIAQHTAPLATGMWASAENLMAGAESFDIIMNGQGGHGSSPHLCKDPVVAGSLAVVQMQTLVSRVVDPVQTAVVTVGAFNAGTDNNIIPDKATLKINTRWFEERIGKQIHEGILNIAESVSSSQGLHPPTVIVKGQTLPLINHKELMEKKLIPALQKTLPSPAKVLWPIPGVTGSEDCHMLMSPFPDCQLAFLLVGTCPPAMFLEAVSKGLPYPWTNHSPRYQVDLNALVGGAQSAFVMVYEILKK